MPKEKETELLSLLKKQAPEPGIVSRLAPPVPLPAQTLSDRQLSCVVSGHAKAVQVRDKSWLCWVPWGWTATVQSAASSVGPLGSALDVRGYNIADLHTSNVTYPLTVQSGSVLVLFSGSAGGNPAPTYGFGPPTSSAVDEALKICFVPYEPFSTHYSPPAAGNALLNPISTWMRTHEWKEANTNVGLLPSVVVIDDLYLPAPGAIDPNGWNQSPPTFAESEAIFLRWWGDLISEWNVVGRIPFANGHQGRGTFVQDATSDAVMLLCSTASTATKTPLAHALVQRGIDEIGRLADGLYLELGGGHCWGRKMPMLMLGYLQSVPAFLDSEFWFGPKLPEDNLFPTPSGWWWGSDPLWTVSYPFSPAAHSNGSAVFNPPTDTEVWGGLIDHGDYAWQFDGYWTECIGTMVGCSLGIKLMRLDELSWTGSTARKMLQIVEQHMVNPTPAPLVAGLAAAGITVTFQDDYGAHEHATAAAWALYAPSAP